MSHSQLVRQQLIYTNPQAGVTVYKGCMLPQALPVAIKEEVHESIGAANNSLKEALAMSSLSHDNICRIYECFLEQGEGGRFKSVLVVELMESDLANEATVRCAANRPWSDSELCHILHSIVAALSYAETRGISHRDIKPQNIFYSQGVVKVGDFGASTVLKNANLMYSLQGSPLYLSPELKRGYIQMLTTGERSLQYDPIKSDVYSLGMTMMHLAILGPPNHLTNLHTLEADTQVAIAGLGHLPYTQFFLSLMLAVDDEQRPTFVNLSEVFSQLEAAPAPQPMVVEPAPLQHTYTAPARSQSPRRHPRSQPLPIRYQCEGRVPQKSFWFLRQHCVVIKSRRTVEYFPQQWCERATAFSWNGL